MVLLVFSLLTHSPFSEIFLDRPDIIQVGFKREELLWVFLFAFLPHLIAQELRTVSFSAEG